MKNLFVALFTLTMCIAVHAQPMNRDLSEENVQSFPDTDTIGMNTYIKTLYTIPLRAVRNFKQTYKNIEQESWFAVENGYRARFVDNGIRYEVTYDKKGTWLYTIRQYFEGKLPQDVRAQVKSVYYDYSIILIEEVIQPLKPLVHVVHLEDRNSFRNIQVCEREMATMLDIEKG